MQLGCVWAFHVLSPNIGLAKVSWSGQSWGCRLWLGLLLMLQFQGYVLFVFEVEGLGLRLGLGLGLSFLFDWLFLGGNWARVLVL